MIQRATLVFGILLPFLNACSSSTPEVGEPVAPITPPDPAIAAAEIETLQQGNRTLHGENNSLRGELDRLHEESLARVAQLEARFLVKDEETEQLRQEVRRLEALLTTERNRHPITAKLQGHFDFGFKGEFRETIEAFKQATSIPVRVQKQDLVGSLIPMSRFMVIDVQNATAEEILAIIVVQGNGYTSRARPLNSPDLNLVYVIDESKGVGHEEIVFTTRNKVPERGRLPLAYQIPEPPMFKKE